MKAVIFDMDGVLINSEPLYVEMLAGFYDRYHVSYELEELYGVIGSSHTRVKEIVRGIWLRSKDEASFEEHFHEYEDGEEVIPYLKLMNPHVKELLQYLKKHHIKTAVASSSPMKDITMMIEQCGLDYQFDVIHSGHEFHASKPDPTIYLQTMKDLAVNQDECLIVEDSNHGIAAAKAAGATCAALLTPYPMDQSEADCIIEDLWIITDLI